MVGGGKANKIFIIRPKVFRSGINIRLISKYMFKLTDGKKRDGFYSVQSLSIVKR